MTDEQKEAQLRKLKPQYFGKTYKWLRAVNNEEVGSCVRVVDVKFRGDLPVLVFNAGTPVGIDIANQYLMEVGENAADIPKPPMLKEMDAGASPYNLPDGAEPETVPLQQAPMQQQLPQAPVRKKSDMFAMFASEEKSINLPLTLKMPDISLVKMMYDNAADKDVFLSEMADYIINNINTEVAKKAIGDLLDNYNKPSNGGPMIA